jgi:SNF2 family DNA or RNA helicase
LLGDLTNFRKSFAGKGFHAEREERVEELRERVTKRVLRRMKEEEVGDRLPSKSIIEARVPMAPWQHQLYDQTLADFKSSQANALATLNELKWICADPNLVGVNGDEFTIWPKLTWLLRTLETIASQEEKVVIFAERYILQDRLSTIISGQFGLQVDRINGKVEGGLRLAKIEDFESSPGFNVLILSPRATSVGLNITAANHVIHFTRHWNPALESQATDRVYRIGQQNPVNVYLPITTHPYKRSFEEHLHGLLIRKQQLASDFLVGIGAENELQNELTQVLEKEAKA